MMFFPATRLVRLPRARSRSQLAVESGGVFEEHFFAGRLANFRQPSQKTKRRLVYSQLKFLVGHPAERGGATTSNGLRSARTQNRAAIMLAAIIKAAPST